MQQEFNLKNTKVMLSIPCGPSIPWQTVKSIVETTIVLCEHSIPHEFQMVAGCSIVEHARSRVCHDFLKSKMTTLFMVDSDMSWSAKDFLRMLALSTELEIVSAAYPCKRDDGNVFMLRDSVMPMQSNKYGCLPIKGVGLGFTVVHRKVIEDLSEKAPKVKFPWSGDEGVPYLFRCDIHEGDARGEDMAFFDDCVELGYQPWLDPNVTLGHVGTKEYRASIKDAISVVK